MKTSFESLVRKENRDLLVIGIDPGEMSGLCLMKGSRLLDAAQVKTKPVYSGACAILRYCEQAEKDFPGETPVLAVEAYRIYPHKLKQHSGSDVHTLRLIGALEYVAGRCGWPMVLRTAGRVKPFFHDKRLKAWSFFQGKKRHANDAIRHACATLVFGTR